MHIFLSYRRDDSAGHAGRLADALEAAFGDQAVFQDVEAIAPGTDFVQAIDAAIARSDVVVALIGPEWLETRTAAGARRLDDPGDFVRLEIGRALRRRVRVLPVLVGGATMPAAKDLPAELAPLSRLQALELSDARWDFDSERVVQAVRTGAPKRLLARRLGLWIAGAVLAGIAIGGGSLLVGRSAPEVGGRWNLASGSYWILVQRGADLTIEETHYDSRQVWKRGIGRLEGSRLAYRLEYVFQPGVAESGQLTLGADGRVLTGEVTREPGGRAEAVTLMR